MNYNKPVPGSFDSLALGNTEESFQDLMEKEKELTNQGHETIHTDDALHFYVNGQRVYDIGKANMMWDLTFAPIHEMAHMCEKNWCHPSVLAKALTDSLKKWQWDDECRKGSQLEKEK